MYYFGPTVLFLRERRVSIIYYCNPGSQVTALVGDLNLHPSTTVVTVSDTYLQQDIKTDLKTNYKARQDITALPMNCPPV